MQRATFSFIGIAFALLLFKIIVHIFAALQYVHSEFIHFLASSTMNELAS